MTGPQGTFGKLRVVEEDYECFTGELPWRDNRRSISCIPEGTYECNYLDRTYSGKFKKVYHVTEVSGRTGILIHKGNYCGDEAQGFKSDIDGCILVGKELGRLDGQHAVRRSAAAMDDLLRALGTESFRLSIWNRAN